MWIIYRLTWLLPIAALAGIPVVRQVRFAETPGVVPTAPAGGTLDSAPRVFASGIVEGRHRDMPLHFEIAGRLESVHVEEGATVSQGQVLGVLDSKERATELNQTIAALRRAEAQRDLLLAGASREARKTARAEVWAAYQRVDAAKKQLDRTLQLAQKNATTGREMDDREMALAIAQADHATMLASAEQIEADPREEALRAAQADVDLARSRVELARSRLQKTELRAPGDGIVLRMHGQVGELVRPDASQPFVVMANLSEKRVRAFVEELDALHVVPGSLAMVEADGLPGQQATGRVIRCSPYLVPKLGVRGHPGESLDVRVREVVIQLDSGPIADQLFVGLPVDVFLQPARVADRFHSRRAR